MKSLLGLFLAFALGAACRWFDIPVPSPPKLLGALLVAATTLGYIAADNYLAKKTAGGTGEVHQLQSELLTGSQTIFLQSKAPE